MQHPEGSFFQGFVSHRSLHSFLPAQPQPRAATPALFCLPVTLLALQIGRQYPSLVSVLGWVEQGQLGTQHGTGYNWGYQDMGVSRGSGMEAAGCKVIVAVKQGVQPNVLSYLIIYTFFTDSQTFLW